MNQVEREKIIKTMKAYQGYAAYCLGMSKACYADGDVFHGDWYFKECGEYQKLVSELQESLL